MRSEASSSADAAGAWGRAGLAAPAPLPAPPGAAPGPGEAAASDGLGHPVPSPAPEPSLGLVSHVNLERLVSSHLQHCKRGGGLGQCLIILCLDAVARVVLFEVEQAACTKGITTME
jgi:hypothetical protein